MTRFCHGLFSPSFSTPGYNSFETLNFILGIVTDHTLGREVVTVNVNQINEDLIRQVGAVSNTVNPPASHSYLQGEIIFMQACSLKKLSTTFSKITKLLFFSNQNISPASAY